MFYYQFVWAMLGLLLSFFVQAAVDIYDFDSESQRQRYHALIEELRCPKCQNQNLSGSNSQIAMDLRRELHRLLLRGDSDQEIKAFMVQRYGDFVLYKPPLKRSTFFLWSFPLLVFMVGLGIFVVIIRQRRRLGSMAKPLNAEEQAELDSFIRSPETHDKQNDRE